MPTVIERWQATIEEMALATKSLQAALKLAANSDGPVWHQAGLAVVAARMALAASQDEERKLWSVIDKQGFEKANQPEAKPGDPAQVQIELVPTTSSAGPEPEPPSAVGNEEPDDEDEDERGSE